MTASAFQSRYRDLEVCDIAEKCRYLGLSDDQSRYRDLEVCDSTAWKADPTSVPKAILAKVSNQVN